METFAKSPIVSQTLAKMMVPVLPRYINLEKIGKNRKNWNFI